VNVSQAVARVYARALVDLAEATDADLGRIFDELHTVQKLVDGEDRTFWQFFASPRLEPAVKKRILDEAFEGKLDRPVLGLLHVLVDKRREMIFDNIVDEFDRYRDLREGRVHAYVTAVRALDEDQRTEMVTRLEAATGKRVELHEKIDPRVLGGRIVKVGDKVIDGSLRRRLYRLRRTLVAAQG
jgi:F-type H+-transporting ATPase subunit delta